jgi:hypothetical protein
MVPYKQDFLGQKNICQLLDMLRDISTPTDARNGGGSQKRTLKNVIKICVLYNIITLHITKTYKKPF